MLSGLVALPYPLCSLSSDSFEKLSFKMIADTELTF
jgi:hypothetical protein